MGKSRAKTRSSKIVNKDKKIEDKKKRNVLYIGGFLIFIMIFSAFGVILYSDSYGYSDDIEIAGFTFRAKEADNMFFWEIIKGPTRNSKYIESKFFSHPSDIYFIENQKAIDLIQSKEFVYISIDSSKLIETEIDLYNQTDFSDEQINAIQSFQIQNMAYNSLSEMLFLKEIYGIPAMTQEIYGIDYPIVTCKNATQEVMVIQFNQTNEFMQDIEVEENCILISSDNPINILKLVESLKLQIMVQNE